jgi:hypothetical protein
MGLIWGITELVAGYFLHMLKTPMSGSLLMPVGIICMTHVYLKTGSKKSTVLVSVIAAAIKAITVLVLPVTHLYLVINPVVAILLEGAILVWPISYLNKKMFGKYGLNLFTNFALFYLTIFFYKICFITFQIFLKGETGAPALGRLSISDNFSYLITETFITVSLVIVYFYLRHIPKAVNETISLK